MDQFICITRGGGMDQFICITRGGGMEQLIYIKGWWDGLVHLYKKGC